MAVLDYPGLTRFKGKIDTKFAGTVAAEYSTSATYSVGDFVIYKNNLYKCTTAINTAEAWTAAHWEACTAGEEFVQVNEELSGLNEKKADKNGNYDDLTVGMAAELDSDIYAEDKEPYNFRKSGGNVTAGRRMYDKIIGGTVVWNQQSKRNSTTSDRGLTITDNADGSITVNGTADSRGPVSSFLTFPSIANHVYLLFSTQSKPTAWSCIYTTILSSIAFAGAFITKETTSKAEAVVTLRTDADAVWDNIRITLNCFDLTQMFGSTIADYIYSLEQATAGAGVAWFRKLFPAPYYPYNAGELMSVKTSAHVMRGFNQWDEEWELGSINSEGQKVTSTTKIRSKNYIPCAPNTTYCRTFVGGSSSVIAVCAYDANYNYLPSIVTSGSLFTTPDNAQYILFRTADSYGTTYNHDICINISKTTGTPKNGDYVAYDGHTYALDSDLELRGIPKLDSNNKLYYDGDIYEASGNVQRKYGIVDLGTLSWLYSHHSSSNKDYFAAHLSNKKTGTLNLNCAKYVTGTWTGVWTLPDKAITSSTSGDTVAVIDSAYTDATAFTTAMSGVYLVYELETPTTETADPFVSPQAVSADGTEEYVDERAVAIPVGHETKYPVDQVAKLDGLPSDLAALIASVEGDTASKNYTVGSYLIHNWILYKVTSAISTGETLTVGSNISATTIMAEILAMSN